MNELTLLRISCGEVDFVASSQDREELETLRDSMESECSFEIVEVDPDWDGFSTPVGEFEEFVKNDFESRSDTEA